MDNMVADYRISTEKDIGRRRRSRQRVSLFGSHDRWQNYYVDDNSDVWRATKFIENTQTYLVAEDREMFADAGRAFGQMLSRLADFDASKLHDVIPNFHNTMSRYDALHKAAKADKLGRLEGAREEFNFAVEHSYLCPVIVDALGCGAIPLRVTHNDTKLNNIMLDHETRKGICVIDLDTVMPGSALYDYGDAIRFGACDRSGG